MKKDMTFSADFARCGYTKVSRQAMQIAFTPGDKCEKEAKVLLCILGFAYFKKGEVSLSIRVHQHHFLNDILLQQQSGTFLLYASKHNLPSKFGYRKT